MEAGKMDMDISVAAQGMSGKLPVVNAKEKNLAKIDKTSKDFEAVFLGQMLQPMFNTVEIDPNMGGGSAEEVYRSMMADEYGKLLANRGGGLGIASEVKKEMLRIQEGNK